MTKLTAKNAELAPYLVKRLSVEVSVLVMARPVVDLHVCTAVTLRIMKQATSPSFRR